MKVTILGCGTSSGVPMIGCKCPVCLSDDPRNKRRRCAITIERDDTTILVDTPPELRLQCVDAGIDRIDAVLYTHAHADHVNGLDDLRSFNTLTGQPVDAIADAAVLARIRERFDYAFQPMDPDRRWWRPCLNPTPMDGPFMVGDIFVRPILQQHGRNPSFGFRVGDFAYCPDVNAFPPESFEASRPRSLDRRLPPGQAASQPRPFRDDHGLDRTPEAQTRHPHPHVPRARFFRTRLTPPRRHRAGGRWDGDRALVAAQLISAERLAYSGAGGV